MTNKVKRFFGKVFSTLIQYTIGLVMPWWLLNAINKGLISSYEKKFYRFSKLHRYTYGIILPWWFLFIVEVIRKQLKKESIESESESLEVSLDA